MPTDYTLDSERLDILELDGESSSLTPPDDEIWFNFFGLQNDDIITQYAKVSAPDLELTQRAFPRADGVYAETAFRRQNRIKIAGTIKAASRTALETAMDAMRKALSAYGVVMRLSWAGVARYYDDCYATNLDSIFDGRDHYHINWCPFSVDFTSQQPFARDADRIALDAPYPVVLSPTAFIVNNAGTATTDSILSLAIVTAGSLSSFTWENAANGDQITVAATFNNGDAVEIDGEEKTVKINGVEVDYSGVIPRAVTGDNIFSLTLVGAAYSISLTEQHYSRYL